MENTTNNTEPRLRYARERIPNRAFYLPFSYLYHVRLGTFPKLLSWILIYIVPTAVYSTLLAFDFTSDSVFIAYMYICMLLFVLTTYETGYIINDTFAIHREPAPTIRLYSYNFEHFYKHSDLIILVRDVFMLAAWSLYLLVMPPVSFASLIFLTVTFWVMALLFIIYNRVRTKNNVFIYPLLVFSRYFVFLTPYCESKLMPVATVMLFLCFPLCNAIERFSMSRYRFPFVRKLIPTEQSKTLFRVCYYGILLIILTPALYSIYPVKTASILLLPVALIALMRLVILIVTRFHQPKNYLQG